MASSKIILATFSKTSSVDDRDDDPIPVSLKEVDNAVSQLSNRNSRHLSEAFVLLACFRFSESFPASHRTTKVNIAFDSAYRTSSRAKKEEHELNGLVGGIVEVIQEEY